ncbi:MAG: hypothetical protein IT185_11475 [Acidobacteria bacterium]|nr:hypothetical protein [Acidobacteriota bacterium]
MFSMFRLKSFAIAAVLATSLVAAGCDDDETPTTPTTPANTASVTWSTNLAQNGQTSRSFTTTRSGTVSLNLQAFAASTTLKAGLGIGIPLADGSGCVLSRSVETAAGSTAQLELTVDAGSYCVQVYDPGSVTGVASFTVFLVYPINPE